jgi:hypothetical protein
MRKSLVAGLGLVAALGVGVTATSLRAHGASASSHAEAPLISQDPSADNTDLYAFRSPDDPSTVTIISNFIPKETPDGGPNFYRFSDAVRYNIKIDNTGDAKEDITYRFRFATHHRTPGSFLYATGIVTDINDPDLNTYQTYSIDKVTGNGKAAKVRTIASNLPVAPVDVGPRTMPDYAHLADQAVQHLKGGVTVFAGPRDDPFYVDLGAIFDLATIRQGLGTMGGGVDGLKGFNVHTIAIQVPISQLTRPGRPTIGIYTSTERRKLQVASLGAGKGPWRQVSRLGNPLVNEVVIPLGLKDHWNASDPADDSQFDSNLLNSELASDLNLLYGPDGIIAHIFDPPLATTNRTDLLTVLETGIGPEAAPGLPELNYTGPVHADLLRLNTGIAPDPCGSENRLGVLGGDLAGYPNGRRPVDDVTDIELRAITSTEPYGFLNGHSYAIGDGVDANDHPFTCSFPYLALPNDPLTYKHDTP